MGTVENDTSIHPCEEANERQTRVEEPFPSSIWLAEQYLSNDLHTYYQLFDLIKNLDD